MGLLKDVTALTGELKKNIAILEESVANASKFHGDSYDHAHFYRFDVFEKMTPLRNTVDMLETMVDADVWPMPTYGDMLFSL
jgi:glutamine synthetase